MVEFNGEEYPGMELFTFHEGTILVHANGRCLGRHCVIHNPSDHHMREWTLHWRGDRAIFERICHHGVGHPDPDQFEFWDMTNQNWQRVHGCCGYCLDRDWETQ